MKTTKRLTISIEKHELKIVRFHKRTRVYCLGCHSETLHLTVSQLAEVLPMSEIEIFRLSESKQFHSTETADGKLMVCVDSVTKLFQYNILGGIKW